jgi:hypothetical protein
MATPFTTGRLAATRAAVVVAHTTTDVIATIARDVIHVATNRHRYRLRGVRRVRAPGRSGTSSGF